MIVLYRGSRGRGKTLTMIKDSFIYFKAGFRIISNIDLKFGETMTGEEVLALNRSSGIKDCVLVLDEIQLFFDSRNFSKKENKDFSYFLQQIRKRNVNILCTSQYENLIELRLRQQVDCVCFPFYDKSTKYCRASYYDLTTLEDEIPLIPYPVSVIYDARAVFPLYDTFQMLK